MKVSFSVLTFSVLILVTLFFKNSTGQGDVPVVCGGLIKSSFQVDFTRIQVNLYSLDGTLKYSTDCAPSNGYFLLPLYDQGEYIVKAVPPEGWMITPNEVPLVVKGSADPCSSGKDIHFQLVGFTLTGQVTSGDNMVGPEGVEISLLPVESLDKDASIRYVYTAKEGRFQIDGVSPGSYQLKASHPLWTVSKDSVVVSVDNAPVTVPLGLKVLGYDAKGTVKSGGEPVKGVLLFLFSQDQDKEVNCSGRVSTSIPSPKENMKPLCIVASDETGQFILYPLPPGTYFVIPVYRQGMLQFEVQPVEVQFMVSNDSVILSKQFEVQGFSVTGKVLLTPEGPPVPDALVFLGSSHATATDEQGRYQLLNVTTGTYTLKIEAKGMLFDHREIHISPTSPSMLPVSPDRYLVCGNVTETISTTVSGKFARREVQVLSGGSSAQVVTTTMTNENGNFCVYLPLGEYRMKVLVPLEEAEMGVLILPEEHFVAMLDIPVTERILFIQFLANLTGTVECIENCPKALDINLIRSYKGSQKLSAKIRNDGKVSFFNFSNVLPGEVQIILKNSDWCWKVSQISTAVVVNGSQDSLKFSHTGYSMSYEVSHDTMIKYYQGNDTIETAVLTGKGSLCLAKPGVYHIATESCHKFGKPTFIFNTSSPEPLFLQSTGHSIHIPVYTKTEDSSLTVMIRSEGETRLRPEKVEQVTQGEWLYSFITSARSSQRLEIIPQSSVLMFSPSSIIWNVGEDCPETVKSFHGSPGEIIEGTVVPAVSNVTVTISLGEDEHITTHTDNYGHYRAGPVRGGAYVTVSLALNGYIFDPIGDSRSFRTIKLCNVIVEVSNVLGSPLSGVLVSISGDNFRQNGFTNKLGSLEYNDLVPGQYFIKPFLREFDFAPSSSILNIVEGKTETIVFNGQRVAFSCSGIVSTLNRQPLKAIRVEGKEWQSSKECSYSDTAISDFDGVYRLHGLMPGCQYNISINQEANGTFITLPPFKILEIMEVDQEKVDFLLLSQTKMVYLSGWVDTDSKIVGTLKVGVFGDGNTEESPLYAVAVDPVGFFEFPQLLAKKGDYLIVLETSLSIHSFKYSTVEQFVSGSCDSHTILQFKAEEVLLEKESQSRGSVLALIVVIITAFACINFDKVLVWIRSYANAMPSPISEGLDSRQRRTGQKIHKK